MKTSSTLDQARDTMKVESFWHDRAQGASRKILTGACLAFHELGYHGASTRIIAQRAEMSPAAVYIHFESKEDLFFQIAHQAHMAALDVLNKAVAISTDPTEQLRLGIAAYASFYAEWRLIASPVTSELRFLTPERMAHITPISKQIAAVLDDILEAGNASGVFAVSDVAGTRNFLLSVCVDVCRWFNESKSSRSASSIGLQYSDLAIKLVSQ